MTATLTPQLPGEGAASGALSVHGDGCNDAAHPSPSAASFTASFTGRMFSFLTSDEDRSRFMEHFRQTAMAAAHQTAVAAAVHH
jgi:hypothetical protein